MASRQGAVAPLPGRYGTVRKGAGGILSGSRYAGRLDAGRDAGTGGEPLESCVESDRRRQYLVDDPKRLAEGRCAPDRCVRELVEIAATGCSHGSRDDRRWIAGDIVPGSSS